VMNLGTLESISYSELYDAFRVAFSDYSIRFDPTEDQLAELHRRRGVRLDLSVGAFDGDAIVGFTFNGFGNFNGRIAGYDSGTGVVPSARGRGLAALMMDRSLEILHAEGASCYVLEVLKENAPAFRIYENAGFRVTRELRSWTLDRITRPATDVRIESAATLEAVPFTKMWDWTPSWQHSLDSLGRAGERRTVLYSKNDGEVEGYAVVFSSGDLAQFAVSRSRRRSGIGTALLHAARAATQNPLRIINIDAADTGTAAFLDSIGAMKSVDQYEMIREIDA